MSLNWTNVKSLAIPVGGVSRDVKRVSIGGSVVWEKPNPLPYDAEVEYLESTGTQWIDTGVDAKPPTVSDIMFRWVGTPSGDAIILGARNNNFTEARFILLMSNQTKIRQIGTGANWRSNGYYDIDKDYHAVTTLASGNSSQQLDGATIITSSNALVDIGKTLYLFASNDATNLYKATARVYRCKIYQNGVLVRDYIPVRKGTVGYLYDRVSGALFGNAGTGDFVLGPDVVPVEWLGSYRNAYINTGFVPNTNTRFDVDMALTELSATFSACGIYRLSPAARFNVGAKTGFWNLSYGNDHNIAATIDTARHHYSVNAKNLRWEFDDTSGTFTENSATYGYPLYLFARNSSNGVAENKMAARIFESKIWDNGNLARNFSPVRVGSGSTWEGAMMDTLTRRIYRNAGTGAFTYGADLPYPIGG